MIERENKELIVLHIFNISSRLARIFLTNHEESIRMFCLREILNFQTLSKKAIMIDLHSIKFENTPALPVIDTNTRRGIIPDRLLINRKIGIALRKEKDSLYSLRLEIVRTFSIL